MKDKKITTTRYIPLTKWPNYHPWPTVFGLRNLLRHDNKNGFIKVTKKVGNRILIDEKKFYEWMEEK